MTLGQDTYSFAPHHLEVFRNSITRDNAYFKDAMLNRHDIFDSIARIKDASALSEVCKDILIRWGGMQRNHFKMLDANHGWLRVAGAILEGATTRKEAYALFAALRVDGELKGMGPAYFTKLIYFLMPRSNGQAIGYIMDQWVGCSVNILAGKDIVVMNQSFSVSKKKDVLEQVASFTVSDINTPQHYENYCRVVEGLSEEMQKSPEWTELYLMSKGGARSFRWREYVRENRLPPPPPIL